ncbi:hypothetical protein [Clostridium sp. UBA7339]|uniref:hypothetical protein n=2 Tax=Clostridium TaxID=1485 RepID=UPI003217E77A
MLPVMKKGTGQISTTASAVNVQNYVKLSEEKIHKIMTENQYKLNLSEKQKIRWHKNAFIW